MRCKKAERLFFSRLDGRLDETLAPALDAHLRTCAACARRAAQHARIARALRPTPVPDPVPGLAHRIMPRLEPRPVTSAPLLLWERWSLRTVPVLMTAVAVAGLALALVVPVFDEPLTSTEILLLQNINPMEEARTIFEQEKPETRGLMLLVASIDEAPPARRDRP
jgi:anti-sigma factor RsiW